MTSDLWPYFLFITDYLPKILVISDYSAVEFNDYSSKRYREVKIITDY